MLLRSVYFSTEVLNLKWERVNPLEGIKRLFSSKSLFDTIKGVIKFVIIFTISYSILKKEFSSFNGLLHLTLYQSFIYGKDIMVHLSSLIIIGLIVLALFDFAWEKYQYRQKLLLSRQQAKEELKEKEGNPEIKQRIRLIQREMAFKRMMADVPKADVIVSNPTHISVALKYDKETMIAPQVIAKGADEIALKIREVAKLHDVPLWRMSSSKNFVSTIKMERLHERSIKQHILSMFTV
jgi:flagellar biosynthetic protein FlhB